MMGVVHVHFFKNILSNVFVPEKKSYQSLVFLGFCSCTNFRDLVLVLILDYLF